MKRLLNWIAIISLLLGTGVTLLLLIWNFYPYETIVFHDPTFPIETKNIHAGDAITYHVDYCKHTDLPATVSRHIVNGYDYTMPSEFTDRPRGCHVVNVSFILPKETPSGTGYSAQIIYRYEVNPLRSILISHSTDKFNVLEASDSGDLQ